MRPTFSREYIEDEFLRIANGLSTSLSVYRGLEVLQALDEPITVDGLATELGLDVDEVHDRIVYLSMFDRIHRDGNIVRPVD